MGQPYWSQQHTHQEQQTILLSLTLLGIAVSARERRSIQRLALAFVGSLLITAGALFVVGGAAEAQESAEAPASDSAQPAGSSAEPSTRDAESQPAPDSDSQPASEPTHESTQEPAPTDTTTEPAPAPAPAPEPAPAPQPAPQPAPEPAPQPAPAPEPAPAPAPAPVHEADAGTAPVALESKLSHEPTLGETSEKSGPASAPAAHQASSPDNIAQRLASRLARAVDTLGGSLPDRVTKMAARAFDVVSRLVRTVGGLLGGDRAPSPGGDPLIPRDAPAPAAPPPVVPIPVGGSVPVGEGFSGGSVPSGGASQELPQLFGAFDVLSLPLSKDSEHPWTWRELLTPTSEPRPPNERPG